MAGFGMILGGALSGMGKGIVEEARQLREMQMKTLEEDRQDARLDKTLANDVSEGALDRESTIAENALDRLAKDTETIEASDGTVLLRTGNKAEPVMIDGGEPPEDNKIYKAGETATQELIPDKPLKVADEDAGVDKRARADLVQDFYKTMKEDFNDERPDEEKMAEAERKADRSLGNTSSKEATSSSTMLPTDKKLRKTGVDYATNKPGQTVRWDGEKIIEVTPPRAQ